MPRPEPLDLFLARRGVGTWAEVRRLIQRQRVRVAGSVCKRYHRALAADEQVEVDGVVIADGPDASSLLCHKPAGVACSHAPEDAPLIYDLVPAAWRHPNLQTAGRLDRDTTGLIVFTIDGRWLQRLVAPEHARWKRYRIAHLGVLPDDAVQRVAAGLPLAGEERPCLPARLAIDPPADDGLAQATLELCEGRHHQVKRMIDAHGGRVVRLHRDRIGGLDLPGDLAPGCFRPLNAEERAALALER
jgi:16S rRNA pseudouridine516 synthase